MAIKSPKSPRIFRNPALATLKPQQTLLEADQVIPSGPCRPRQSSCNGCYRLVYYVHWNKLRRFASVGLKAARRQRAGAGVLRMEDFQYRLACLGAYAHRLEDPYRFPVSDSSDSLSKLPLEHQAVVDLRPMLWGVLTLLVEIYFVQVRVVSFAIISNSPASQASIWKWILLRIAPYMVT